MGLRLGQSFVALSTDRGIHKLGHITHMYATRLRESLLSKWFKLVEFGQHLQCNEHSIGCKLLIQQIPSIPLNGLFHVLESHLLTEKSQQTPNQATLYISSAYKTLTAE